MAMASISARCSSSSVSTVSCTPTSCTTPSCKQSVTVQCVSGRARGDGSVVSDRRRSADTLVLRQSSKTRILGRHPTQARQHMWRVDAGLKETTFVEEKWGPPITLGTAQLPQDIDLNKLRTLLYQWGNSLIQNANLPLPVPLKVDRIEDGVRLGYIRVIDGKVEDLVHIDVLVTPASDENPKAMFQAIRNGQMKTSVPPGEPLIMQSLLAALKLSLPLARTSS